MKTVSTMALVSKLYCSSSQAVLVIRRRPQVANGGGFVVTDCSHNVIFKVDGCGILGSKDELILRDGNGDALLLIRRMGGMIEALSISRRWRATKFNYESAETPLFDLKESNSCFTKDKKFRICTKPRISKYKDWDFEVNGNFPNRECSINDSLGNIIAQIGVKKEVKESMGSNDIYHVMVKPGIDQAFVFGVIAILDYIHGESTRC